MIDTAPTPQGAVLIGGLQRSGTSWVRAMVGSAEGVAMVDFDWPLLTRLREIYGGELADRPIRYRRLVVGRVLLHTKALRSQTYKSLVGQLSEDVLEGRIADYDALIQTISTRFTEAKGASRFGMKTPGLELAWPEISPLFPDARFLHVLRNPEQSYLSAQHYGIGTSAARWAELWRRSTIGGEAAAGRRYLMVRYDDLVTDVGAMARKIASFCDLPFNDEMSSGRGHAPWQGRNSSFTTARQRPEIDKRDQQIIREVAGDVMSRWGYLDGAASTPHRPVGPVDRLRTWVSDSEVVARRAIARTLAIW